MKLKGGKQQLHRKVLLLQLTEKPMHAGLILMKVHYIMYIMYQTNPAYICPWHECLYSCVPTYNCAEFRVSVALLELRRPLSGV